MGETPIDLKREQQATLARPRYDYSVATRGMVRGMDVVAGSATTLHKAKVVEALAPVPYSAWESHESRRLSGHGGDEATTRRSAAIVHWGREARDNEYQHFRVIVAKMREDGVQDPALLKPPMPGIMVGSWKLASGALSRVAMERAFLMNAEAEDHAEHYYAELVELHPEWEEQPVTSEVVREYGEFATWADVFRRMGLDERDHRNASFAFAGRPDLVVTYEGMPENPGLG